MDLVKAIAILVPGILANTVVHDLVIITPLGQASVDVILVGIDETARLDHLLEERFDRHLLDIS